MITSKISTNQAQFNLNPLTKTMDSLNQELITGKEIKSPKDDPTGRVTDSPSQQLSTAEEIKSPKDDPTGWVKVSESRFAFNDLQVINASFNTVAKSIRVADTTMETIEKHIDKMKAQLEIIVKNFPPFPPGSEERVKLLTSFVSLRKQIDQLTIPPNDDGAMKIMADPNVVPDAGDQDILVGDNGFRKTIHGRQVHTGPNGLDIPELSEDATDEEIYASIENLDTAKETLRQRRTGLFTDAMSIKDFQYEHNPLFAEFMSTELKHTLTSDSVSSLTETPSQLIELLD